MDPIEYKVTITGTEYRTWQGTVSREGQAFEFKSVLELLSIIRNDEPLKNNKLETIWRSASAEK
jgi:hypothetical protein